METPGSKCFITQPLHSLFPHSHLHLEVFPQLFPQRRVLTVLGGRGGEERAGQRGGGRLPDAEDAAALIVKDEGWRGGLMVV